MLGTWRMLTGQNHLKDKSKYTQTGCWSNYLHVSNVSEGTASPRVRCQVSTFDILVLENHHEVPHGGHVRGDRLLCVLPLWLDLGVLHSSHGVLDFL